MKRRVLLVCNPVAGPSRSRGARMAALREGLRNAGHLVEERVTGGPGDAERVVEAEAGGWEVVVSVGGDGTANEVVNGLIRGRHADTALAVAPLGTGNDLAQLLGTSEVPLLTRAVNEAAAVPMDTLELIPLGGAASPSRHGVLFAGCGLVTSLLECTTPRVKRLFGGRGSYTVGFLRALIGHQPREMRFRTAGADWTSDLGTVLVVAKARHAGGRVLRLAPRARLNDGLLHVLWLGPADRRSVVGHFLRLTRGTHEGHPELRCFQTEWVEVMTDSPMSLALDGEVCGSTRVRIQVRPRSVSVLSLLPL